MNAEQTAGTISNDRDSRLRAYAVVHAATGTRLGIHYGRHPQDAIDACFRSFAYADYLRPQDIAPPSEEDLLLYYASTFSDSDSGIRKVRVYPPRALSIVDEPASDVVVDALGADTVASLRLAQEAPA